MRRAFLTLQPNGPSWELEARTLVGRGGHCDVVLPSGYCSREHILLTLGDEAMVEDLVSSSGTFVQSGAERARRITRRTALLHGDRIFIGQVALLFTYEAPPKRPAVAELLALVGANPADDVPRRVLADALTEAGDLQGELITLQLGARGGRTTGLAALRERELLEVHARDWLPGGVDRGSGKFERGLLSRCRWTGPTDPHHRGWVSVEVLECDCAYPVPRQFSPFALQRPALREIHGAGLHSLPALAGAELPNLRLLTVQTTLRDLVQRDSASLAGLPAVPTFRLDRELGLLDAPSLPALLAELARHLEGKARRLQLWASPECARRLAELPALALEVEELQTGLVRGRLG